MNLKKFIKKRLEKNNTRFLVRKFEINKNIYTSEYLNLTELTKYLKKNEMKIENIHINSII